MDFGFYLIISIFIVCVTIYAIASKAIEADQ